MCHGFHVSVDVVNSLQPLFGASPYENRRGGFQDTAAYTAGKDWFIQHRAPRSGEQLRVLQDAEIRFSGQPVALVVATTQAQALYAASLVRVTYAPAPDGCIRFDPAIARPTSEIAARRGRGPETKQGDPDAAFASAPVQVDANYLRAREQHNAMELHVTVAQWQGDRLTLWSKTQWVGNERDEIARRFGIAPETVRMISPFVGDAFGSALRTWPHVTLAALAAGRAGRPVRQELTRRQRSTVIGFRPRRLGSAPAWCVRLAA